MWLRRVTLQQWGILYVIFQFFVTMSLPIAAMGNDDVKYSRGFFEYQVITKLESLDTQIKALSEKISKMHTELKSHATNMNNLRSSYSESRSGSTLFQTSTPVGSDVSGTVPHVPKLNGVEQPIIPMVPARKTPKREKILFTDDFSTDPLQIRWQQDKSKLPKNCTTRWIGETLGLCSSNDFPVSTKFNNTILQNHRSIVVQFTVKFPFGSNTDISGIMLGLSECSALKNSTNASSTQHILEFSYKRYSNIVHQLGIKVLRSGTFVELTDYPILNMDRENHILTLVVQTDGLVSVLYDGVVVMTDRISDSNPTTFAGFSAICSMDVWNLYLENYTEIDNILISDDEEFAREMVH